MRKVFCLCTIIVMLLTACSDTRPVVPSNNTVSPLPEISPLDNDSTVSNYETDSPLPESTVNNNTISTSFNDTELSSHSNWPKITDTVIYDSEELTITAKSLEYDSHYDSYLLLTNIQNHSPRTISYELDHAIVNGYTISTWAFGDIYNYTEANVEIWFPHDEIQIAGIKAIQEIKFVLKCSHKDDNTIICRASADLKTSDYGVITEEYNFDGVEVFATDDYRIMLAPNDNPTTSHPLIVYVENNTDNIVMLSYDSIAMNNLMVMEWITGAYVLPMSRRIEEMNLFYFGNEPEIDVIDSVTLQIVLTPSKIDGSFSSANTIEIPPVTILMNN